MSPVCLFYLCISVVHLIGLDGLAAGLAAMVDYHIELCPSPELPLPVGDGGQWGNDQEWPLNALHVNLIEECYGLNGLSKTHLISQDTVSSVKKQMWTMTMRDCEHKCFKNIEFTLSFSVSFS